MNDPTRAPRETLYHRRDRDDLINLLAAAGCPASTPSAWRAPPTTTLEETPVIAALTSPR